MTDITPDLCDLHADLVRVLEPMLVNYGGCEAFSGEIVTVKCFEDNSLVKEQLNTPGADKVLVVDGGGSMRRALLGDMIAESAVKQGWQGVIIYGCIRDVSAISEMPLGVQAMACVPVKTEKRGIGDVNVPVCFGGVTFNPGEYVYADSNGVLVSAQLLTLPG